MFVNYAVDFHSYVFTQLHIYGKMKKIRGPPTPRKTGGIPAMERDYGAELDEIRRELQAIQQQLDRRTAAEDKPFSGDAVGKVYRTPDLSRDSAMNQVQRRLERECGENGDYGRIAYAGVFTNGENQSTWARESVSADGLLHLAGTPAAGRVLKALGGPELSMLTAMLKGSRSVAQLVEDCGFGTTGQGYHHLKALLAAGLVQEEPSVPRGRYRIIPHKVQGVLMLLCGVADLLALPGSSES